MKKYKYLVFLLLVLFLPFSVYAETCDSSSIKLESIEPCSIIGNVEEVSPATINGKQINLDLKLYDPGDSIVYNLKVKNDSNEDFYFDEQSLKLNTDYLEYEFIYDDNSNIVSAGEEKNIKLRVNYKNKVPAELLVNDSFKDTNTMTVNLANRDIFINPKTGNLIIKCLLVILFLMIFSFMTIRSKKIKFYMLIIIGIIFTPMIVNALCKCDIKVDSKIEIDGKEAYFLTGSEVNIKMKELAGVDTSVGGMNEYAMDENIISIIESKSEPSEFNKNIENTVSKDDSPYPIYMWYEDGTIYWWSEDKSPNLNENSRHLFFRFENLSNIDDISSFDSTNVTNFEGLFTLSHSITNVDALRNWNTPNLVNMNYMFNDCSGLLNVNGINNWDVSKVKTIRQFITGAINIEEVDFSNWHTDSLEDLTNFAGMWTNQGMTTLDSKLKRIKLSENFNTSKVTSFAITFVNLPLLEDYSFLKYIDTSNAENIQGMFQNNYNLKNTHYIKDWNVKKVTNMKQLFYGCRSLEEADFSKWETPNLTNMANMFGMWEAHGEAYFDGKLKRVILSDKFDTSKVTDMNGLFANNRNIEDYSFLRYFNTSSVTNMKKMFAVNVNLTDLEPLKNWDVSNVTSFEQMFLSDRNINNMSEINNWNISSSANFNNMFENVQSHPEFTSVSGTWDNNGTFIPN